MKVTLALKDGGETVRLTETVSERWYGPAEVHTMLMKAGLSVRECEDFNFTADPAVGKIKTWWVAEKRG